MSKAVTANQAVKHASALIEADDRKGAQRYLAKYLDDGGNATVAVLTSFLSALQPEALVPMKTALKQVDLALELGRKSKAFLAPELLVYLCMFLNDHDRAAESVAVIELALKRGVELTGDCYAAMAYGAWITRDQALMKRVAAHIDAALDRDADLLAEAPVVFDNAASIHLHLGDQAKAIAYVRLCKAHGYEGFRGMEASPDYAALADNAEFRALFQREPPPPIDMLIVGQLDFDAEREQAWRQLPLAPVTFAWPDAAPVFRGDSEGAYATVGSLLDGMQESFAAEPTSPSFFEIEGTRVSAFLSQQHSPQFHQDLATALRLSSRVGAEGTAHVILLAEQAALTLTINEDAVAEAPGWGPAQAVLGDDATAGQITEVIEWMNAKRESPSLRRSEHKKAVAQLGVGPLDELHRTLLAELAQIGAKALYRGVTRMKTPNGQPLKPVWPDVGALESAIRAADPLVRVLGLELLARVKPEKAMALAEQLVKDASPHVRRRAIGALAYVPDAVSFLLATLADETLGIEAAEALILNKAADVEPRLLAALDADLRGGSAGIVFATNLLFAVGKRGMTAAVPRLFALWNDHPVRQVRKESARALGLINSPEVLARDQDLAFTLLGMGKALNSDDVLRCKLLEIDEKDESFGIRRFGQLTAQRLQRLAEEGFIDLSGTQNHSPSAGDFLAFMQENPEVTAGGYAVSIQRFDSRVSLDSIEVQINDVPEARRQPVRQVFEALAAQATNSEMEDGRLYVWWT